MNKMKYIKPNLRIVDMYADDNLLAASMKVGNEEAEGDAWTKEDKGVWDKVWDRDPVFDSDKNNNSNN